MDSNMVFYIRKCNLNKNIIAGSVAGPLQKFQKRSFWNFITMYVSSNGRGRDKF